MYIILCCIIILVLLYYVFVKPLEYWKERRVPQYNSFRILKDNLIGIVKQQGLAQTFESLCKSFPDARYFGVYELFGKALVIQDPDLIKKITVKDFDHFIDHVQFTQGGEPLWERNLFALKGDKWKSMRSTLSPSFTSSKMKIMFNLMLNSTENFITYFQDIVQQEKCVVREMKGIFKRFANDVIASMAFGYSCDSLRDPENEFYLKAKEIVPEENLLENLKLFVVFTFPKLANFLDFKFLPKTTTDFFWKIIRENIKVREEKGIVRHDMIHLLMEERKNRAQDDRKEDITDIDITAQALIFFFAGFESVSALMSFTAYELAVNPDVQTKLQAEVDNTLEECGGTITYDALFNMKYLDMVMLESLRKWPTAIVTDRVCTKTYEIQPEKPDEVPVHLKSGDIVWIPMIGIHRNAELFPNPNCFDPERFSDENKTNIHTYSFIPFGSGPRSCIANRFALMETKLLFFQILSKFDIVAVEKTDIPLQLATVSFQLTAKNGFWLGLKLRNAN